MFLLVGGSGKQWQNLGGKESLGCSKRDGKTAKANRSERKGKAKNLGTGE
jgi:hypothetical protein